MGALRRICAGSIALFAGIASAQNTVTKADNQSDLALAASWLGGLSPSSADIALWDSTVIAANSVSLGADLSWLGLRITNPGGPVTINSGNVLTLDASGIDLSQATQDLTLNNAVTLGSTQSWNVGADRTLAVSGAIGDGGSFFGLTKTGSGTLALTGANTYSGPTVVNRGNLLLNFAPAGAADQNIINATSALQLSGGTLTVQGAANETNTQAFSATTFGAGLSTINVSPGANGQATLGLSGITAAIDSAVRINSTGTITATSAVTRDFGILGGGGSVGINVGTAGFATMGLDDFAALSNGSIVGGNTVAGFYQTAYGANFDMTSNTVLANGVAQRAATVVRYNTPTATTLTGGTSNLITFTAALITPNMGANNASLAGAGTWQIIRQTNPNGPQQGTIWQNNPLGFYSITIPITDGREGTLDPSRLVKAGAGTAVFSGANTYTGATSIYEGALMITADNNLGGPSAPVLLRGGSLFGNANFSTGTTRAFTVEDNGGFAASTGNTMTISGLIGGAGTLVIGSSTLPGTGPGTANPVPIVGDGKVALTADNFYSGGTRVNVGTATISGINTLGGANYGGLTLTNGGTLQYASTLTSGSDVTIGTGLALGAGGGVIDTNGNSVAFANGARGSGSLTKTGAGTLTLEAASTYSGGTIVNAGTLRIAAPTGSATGLGNITVNSGATLAGAGTLAGSVMINAGGILEPGNGVGTLTLPGLTLGADSVLKFEFNATPANDLIQVTGLNGLNINGGKVNVHVEGTGSPFATAGTYNLFSFNGAIQGVGTSAFAVVNPAAGFAYNFGTNANFITLTVATTGLVTSWAAPAGGSWNTAANWNNGVPNVIGATAVFGNALASAGTVTLDGNKTIGSATFDSPNSYTINPGTGGSLTLQANTGSSNLMVPRGSHTINTPVVLGSNLVAEVGPDSALSLAAAVSGARSVTKRGEGVLILGAANTYSAGTTVEGGTIGIGDNAALGAGEVLVSNSATLRADSATLSIGNGVAIGSGATATIDTQANNLTLSGAISDATTGGILRKRGSGSLTLTGTNTYTGGTVINNGTLIVNGIAALGTGGLTFSGDGTLQQLTSLTVPSAVNLNAGVTATFDTNGSDMTLNGNVVGASASVIKAGAGSLALVGSNNFGNSGSAALQVNQGTVLFGSAAAVPAGLGAVLNGGTLDLNSFSATLGSLAGTAGIITDNAFVGGTTTLTVNQNVNTTFAGAINNGPVQVLALTKTGTGTLVLSGNNSFTGGVNANGGGLQLDAGGVIAGQQLTVTGGGTFSVNGGSVFVNGPTTLNSNGGAVLQVIDGTAAFTGAVTATTNSTARYLINVQGGTVTAQSLALGRTGLNFSAEPAAGSTTDGLYVQGGTVDITGALTMGPTNGTNSSVSTRLDAGTLNVGGPITVGLNNGGRWSILDVNGGTLASTDVNGGILLGGPFAGSAILLVRAGTATAERIELTSLTGATSVLNVAGGSLYVGSGGIVQGAASAGAIAARVGTATIGAKANWTSSLPISLTGTATFRAADAGDAARDITLTGVLSEFGSVFKTGDGTLSLTGANNYFGGTTINAGVVSVNSLANGGLPSGIGASTAESFNLVLNGGTLRYTGAATTTDRSFNIGSAGATIDASGTGALKFTSPGALGFVEVDVPHILTLTGSNPEENTLAAAIVDAGASPTTLAKSGAGTWVLSGAGLYSGPTTISGGLLKVTNSIGSATGSGAVTVNGGGAFGGSGTISGLVALNAGARLVPGSSVGTLTIGGLTIAANSILDFEFNGTPSNDRVIVSGNNALTINGGGFNLFAEGTTSKWTTPGTYNLLQYAGTLGGSASNLSVLNPQNGLSYAFGTSGGFVTLTIGTNVIFSNWVPATGGSWNTAANWSSGVPNAVDAAANFLGAISAAGTVSLDGNKTVGTLQFNNSNGYTISAGSGGTLTLNVGTGAAQITSLNGSHTISAPVSLASDVGVDVSNSADTLSFTGTIGGSGSLTKNAAGVLRLSGTNTFSGGVVLNGGVIEVASNGALGAGTVSINGNGSLRAGAAGVAVPNSIIIGNNATATVDTGAESIALTGTIGSATSNGALAKTGSGTLSTGDANTYAGATIINAGVLAAGLLADGGMASSIGQSTNAAANLVINGGTLRYTGAGTSTDRLFTVGVDGATLDASGTGAVAFSNVGAVAFAGTNTASTITLTGSNTGANSLGAVIANNGTAATSLNKTGPGNWVLNGTNTFTGDTTIAGGLLTLGNPLALQRSSLSYFNQGGALAFDSLTAATLGGLSGSQNLELSNTFAVPVALTVGANNASTTYAGALTGFGSLTKTGNGILTLAGQSTYTGTTAITGGVLRVAATDAISPFSAVTVNVPGGLQLSNNVTLNSGITAAVGANEFIDVPEAAATATLAGPLGLAGGGNQFRLGISGAGSTLNVTGPVNFGNAGSIIFLTRGNIAFGGASTINSAPGITFGRSTQALNVIFKDNTVANISGGSGFGGGQANPSISMTVQDSAVVNFNAGLDLNASSAVPNQTTLNLNGGVLGVSAFFKNSVAANQLTALNFNGGTLRAASSSATFLPAFNGLTANVQGGGAKVDTNGFDITIAQPLAHDAGVVTDGGLTKSGFGTLILAGDATFNGPTQVEAGTLVLNGSLSGTASVAVTGATLGLGAGNRINDSAAITLGAAGVFNSGGFNETVGTMTLSGDAIIDLGAGSSVLHFASSASVNWGPGILTIAGWNGLAAGLGQDEIFFGTTASGLTAAQISQVRFVDPAGFAPGVYEARMLASGELVVVPEPGSAVLLLAGMGLLLARQRRRE